MAKWILPLILAGSGSAAAAEEARHTLGVSATVVESCTIDRGSARTMACTTGTSWTGSKSAEPLVEGASSRTVEQGTTYLTITY